MAVWKHIRNSTPYANDSAEGPLSNCGCEIAVIIMSCILTSHRLHFKTIVHNNNDHNENYIFSIVCNNYKVEDQSTYATVKQLTGLC